MCLGLTCRVETVPDRDWAVVSAGERTMRVSLLTLDEPVEPGDWVLAHAGFALARLTEDQALEALALREPVRKEPR